MLPESGGWGEEGGVLGSPKPAGATQDGPPSVPLTIPGSQPGWALPSLALGCQPEDWPAAQASKTLTPGGDDQGTPAPRL